MILRKLKLALRHMVRQQFFTGLNMIGLSLGAASFILIWIYITDELSYDQFHENKAQLYRVNMTNIWIENNDVFGSTGPGIAKALKKDIPEIEYVVRVHAPFQGSQIVNIDQPDGTQSHFKEDWILAADQEFFALFTFPLIEGNAATALREPNSLVVSQSYAEKYFGKQPALGRILTIGAGPERRQFKVTGVAEDVPEQSHFDFDLLVSMKSFPNVANREDTWWWTTFVTYARLNKSADPLVVQSKIEDLAQVYVGEEIAREKNWKLFLQKVTDIRLHSGDVPNRFGTVGSIDNVYIFGAIALLIVVLSCVNFMSLSTARYATRLKEVSIQKVMGAGSSQLAGQFLVESLVYALFAVILGLGLAEMSLDTFNAIADKQMTISLTNNMGLLTAMGLFVIVVGLLSGSYPAWFLTRFKASSALKEHHSVRSNRSFRTALVVFQFSLAIALMSGTLLVKNQLSFLESRALGFDESHVLVVPNLEWMEDEGDVFVSQLRQLPQVTYASKTNAAPPNVWGQDNFHPHQSDLENLAITAMSADAHFLKAMGIDLVAGRQFFEEGDGDKKSVIINEACGRAIGWIHGHDDPATVLGKQISYYGEDNTYTVIGVMKDFNFWNVILEVEPLAIFHPEAQVYVGDSRFALVKVTPSEGKGYQEILSTIEGSWNSLAPGYPFEYSFLEADFDAAFGAMRRFQQVINAFTILTIVITLLGLIGLISFNVEQRTKEFGIRKVLGASTLNLVRLITLNFSKPIIISVTVGALATSYLGGQWLENFTLRTPISPLIFIWSLGMLVVIVLVVSIFIVYRNSIKNPALVLRDE